MDIASLLNPYNNPYRTTLNQLSKSQNDNLRQNIHKKIVNGPSPSPYISNDTSDKTLKSIQFENHRRALEKTVNLSRSLVSHNASRMHASKVRPHDTRPVNHSKHRNKFSSHACKSKHMSNKLGEHRLQMPIKRTFCDINNEESNLKAHKYVKVSDTEAKKSKSDSQPLVPNVESLDNKPQSNNDKVCNEFYNMSRLDLGFRLDSIEGQQELKSRLKAMTYSNKVLTEDTAIVVPCLPSILYPPTP